MMGWWSSYGYGGMMNSGLGLIFGLIVLIDAILLGIWLVKQIQKK